MRKTTRRYITVAAVAAAAFLLYTAAGTYARYTTSATASDTARIAKWGVELTAAGDLYGEQYGEDGTAQSWSSSDRGVVHVSSKGTDVIAPGTSHDGGLRLTVSGSPEVMTRVDAVIKSESIYLKKGTYAIARRLPDGAVSAGTYETMQPGLYYLSGDAYLSAPTDYDDAITEYYVLENKTTLTADYYPVVYSSERITSADISADSLKAVAADIAGRLGSAAAAESAGVTTYTVSAEYAPGTDLGSALGLTQESIGWSWSYMQGDEGSEQELMYSGADTILGSLSAGEEDHIVLKSSADGFTPVEAVTDYHLTTGLDLTMTVTQVGTT